MKKKLKKNEIKFLNKNDEFLFTYVVSISNSKNFYSSKLQSEKFHKIIVIRYEKMIKKNEDWYYSYRYSKIYSEKNTIILNKKYKDPDAAEKRAIQFANELGIPFQYIYEDIYSSPDEHYPYFALPNKDVCLKCINFVGGERMISNCDKICQSVVDCEYDYLISNKVPENCPYELEISLKNE